MEHIGQNECPILNCAGVNLHWMPKKCFCGCNNIYEWPKWLGPRFLRKWLNRFQISLAQKQIRNCLQDYMFLDFSFSPRGACPSPLKVKNVRVRILSNRVRSGIKLRHLSTERENQSCGYCATTLDSRRRSKSFWIIIL